jgi:hypothetical protein
MNDAIRLFAWPKAVERIRDKGSPGLNSVLDRYFKKRFASPRSCWVPGARRSIMSRVEKEGL